MEKNNYKISIVHRGQKNKYIKKMSYPSYDSNNCDMFISRAGQYLNRLYLNTVFKYIYCIYTLYLNTFFNLYLITVFKYF